MFFFTLSRADIWFVKREFVLRIYMAAKALPTNSQIEIIRKKEFLIAILNTNKKTFMMHIIASIESTIMLI